jgi:hypothetical protein
MGAEDEQILQFSLAFSVNNFFPHFSGFLNLRDHFPCYREIQVSGYEVPGMILL